MEKIHYSMPQLSQVKINSNKFREREKERGREKNFLKQEAAMAAVPIIRSRILCYYLFGGLSRIK